MKKTILAALAIVALASCAKETTETTAVDPTDPVAATFTSAAITRVAGESWVAGDQIGITMVKNKTSDLADGSYENVPYNVDADATGKFTADNEVIYFPVDASTSVDFIAYYPYTADTDVDADNNIEVSVATQTYAHIDLVAAKAVGKTKSTSAVEFTDTEAFTHQLSKLTMNIVASDGITSLSDITATIKGQYTTATFNIYSFDVTPKAQSKGSIAAITKSTSAALAETATPAKAVIEAILIPTSAIADSTIEFATGGNTYYLDTKEFAFTEGCEHTYTITLTRTVANVSGAKITEWGTGAVVNSGTLDASDLK